MTPRENLVLRMVLVLLLVGAVIVVSVIAVDYSAPQEQNSQEGVVYQGAVPENYDLDYFRKTGITRPIVKNDLSNITALRVAS